MSRDGAVARIRKWVYFQEGKIITYDIAGSRFCENVGRHHKSNGVMIVVQLAVGIFFQRCFDPDCRAVNYKSSNKYIPTELNPFRIDNDADDEDENAALDALIAGCRYEIDHIKQHEQQLSFRISNEVDDEMALDLFLSSPEVENVLEKADNHADNTVIYK